MRGERTYSFFRDMRARFGRVKQRADIETFGGTLRITVKGDSSKPLYYVTAPFTEGMNAFPLTRDDLLKLADLCKELANNPPHQEDNDM